MLWSTTLVCNSVRKKKDSLLCLQNYKNVGILWYTSPCISPLFLLNWPTAHRYCLVPWRYIMFYAEYSIIWISILDQWKNNEFLLAHRETSTSDLQRTFLKIRYSYSDSLRRRKLLPYLLSYFKQNIHDNCKNADDLECTCKHCSNFMSCIKFCHRCFLCMVLLNMWIHNIAISFSGYL